MPTPRVIALAMLWVVVGSTAPACALVEPARRIADEDPPIGEPAFDDSANHLVRDAMWAMTVYQLRKVFDPRVTADREAANVNALDEVPDSTWFTNRHGRRRMTPTALLRGPNGAHAPAASGPLVVIAAKPKGMTEGFVVRDAKGDRYLVKLDPPGYPEVPTGAEMVCTKILHALGWNVPENYLVRLEPSRLVVEPRRFAVDADGRTRGGPHDTPLSDDDLRAILADAERLPDGRLRAVASRWLPGVAKGGFRMLGRRADDPDDLVPHQDRRELRGLRVVAAWINYTDARRGNFLDTFVPDPAGAGRGRLVHYLLDFSSALGAGNDDWKSPRYGHEYFVDPAELMLRAVTLGMVRRPWDDVPLAHPALGYFDADTFDPEAWRTTYPNPLFDAATVRDAFWGAKLVSSLTDDDLRVVARAAEWSDPRAEELLVEILRRRQRAIARVYFDARRINPIDDVAIDARGRLRFRDLAVESGVAAAAAARHRHRVAGAAWQTTTPDAELPLSTAPMLVDLETSHDAGAHWSPPTRVTVEPKPRGGWAVTAIDRTTR